MTTKTITREVVLYTASQHTKLELERDIAWAKGAIERFPNDIKTQNALRHRIELYEASLAYAKNNGPNFTFRADTIKAKIELTAYIGRFTTLYRSGLNKYNGLCPLHNDTRPSLFVYTERQDWYCFGCLRGGDIFNFVQFYHDVGFYDALKILSSEV